MRAWRRGREVAKRGYAGSTLNNAFFAGAEGRQDGERVGSSQGDQRQRRAGTQINQVQQLIKQAWTRSCRPVDPRASCWQSRRPKTPDIPSHLDAARRGEIASEVETKT